MSVLEISRVDRLERTYNLAPLFPELDLTGATATLALLPKGANPTALTVWTSATLASGSVTVILAGPDADPTGALAVPATADLWVKVTAAAEVDAAKLARITVLGGGALLVTPPTAVLNGTGAGGFLSGSYPNPGVNETALTAAVQAAIDAGEIVVGGAVDSVNGQTGVVTLTAANVGAATAADITTASTADRARANHTGTQSADTLTDGTTNKAFLATERTKLTGVATGATANATDAQLRDRSTHTGTQAAGTITGLATVATTGAYNDLSGKPTLDTWGLDLIATSDPSQAITAVGGGVDNRVVFQRILGSGTITKVGITVITSVGNIAIALYRSSGSGRSAAPSSLVATTGSIPCPAIGWAEISLGGSFTVQPGDWFAIGASNAGIQVRGITNAASTGDGYAGRAMFGDAHYPPATNPTGLTIGLSRGPLVIGVP